MADHSGKAQFFVAFRCPPEYEAEGDRCFAQHAAWMGRTHPRDGDEALLQYTVTKGRDDEGNVLFLLYEVYATKAGVENHGALAHRDEADSGLAMLQAFSDKCETIGTNEAEVRYSLW